MATRSPDTTEEHLDNEGAPPATEKPDDSPKCANHPLRKAKAVTFGAGVVLYLCDECTPSWGKTAE